MDVAENLKNVLAKIRHAEERFHRVPNSVRLLAVSKTHPPALIREVYEADQKAFGENYLQEAIEKQEVLHDCPIEWHYIGAVQSNKTKLIAAHFDWVHGVNRFKIANRLHEQRPAHLPPLNICVEVNVSRETTKSGVMPEVLQELISKISVLDRLQLRGLMAIPKHYPDFDSQRMIFEEVAVLQRHLIEQGVVLDTLSMGMSQDFEAAIAAGSTMVRIGTAIFGPRQG